MLLFKENFFPNIPSVWPLDFATTLLRTMELTVPWGSEATFEQIQLEVIPFIEPKSASLHLPTTGFHYAFWSIMESI